MIRTLIAGITAATLTLGSLSPAYAQQQQLSGETIAKIAAGAAGLFIIGKAIENRNDRRREERAAEAAAEEAAVVADRRRLTDEERRRLERILNRDDRRFERPRDSRHVRGYDQCWRETWQGRKLVRYRDGHCMKRLNSSKRSAANLPRACLRQRWTSNGWERYWSSQCLRSHGISSRSR